MREGVLPPVQLFLPRRTAFRIEVERTESEGEPSRLAGAFLWRTGCVRTGNFSDFSAAKRTEICADMMPLFDIFRLLATEFVCTCCDFTGIVIEYTL